MIHQLLTVVLGPVLLVQGLAVRQRVPKLPEPPGPGEGVTGDGPPLRIVIVGDSAAAGIGAAHQDEALLGHVVAGLAPAYRVHWALVARTGATTASTLVRLRNLKQDRFDAAVTSLGVNDAISGVTLARWRAQQRELLSVLHARFGVSHAVVSGLPPVEGFPALPQPLRWYLGRRARQLSRELARDVRAQRGAAGMPRARFLPLDFTRDVSLMASDGFHPGPKVYETWGRLAVESLLDMLDAEPAAQQD